MKKSITWQLGIIIVFVIFISMIITSLSNYWSSYRKTYEAAGIEAVGCANITTGLVNPADIEALIKGNKGLLSSVENTLDWTTEHKRIFEDQYIISLDGKIIAADDNLKEQGFKAGDPFYVDKEVIEMMKETKHPHYSEIYEFGGMKRLTGYAPIFKDHDSSKEIIAINAIDFNAKIVSERTLASVWGSFLFGILPMAAACVITIWMIRRKTKSITDLIDYSKQIADGNLAASDVLIKNNDEIGDLANTLNMMKANLRDVINQVNTSAGQVASSSEQLTASADQSSHASEQITQTMYQMASSVEKQVQSIEETYQTVHEMSIGVQQIANSAQSVSAAAVETSEKASEGENAIQTAAQQMKSINDTVKGLSEVIIGLGERSNEISHITGVITGIADQTNLLALNAAIEAARAGENGRGFAVVADEVRKLAEQSAESAKEISELLAATKDETNKAIKSMEYASKAVLEGIGIVDNAGNSFTQIQHSIEDVTAQIQEVSSASQQMAEGATQMVEAMQFITEVAEESSSSAQKVSSSTEEQLASTEEISASASYLAKMAEELQHLINKFKV
ncbi:methyl-accepting chemotaxis protein [Bacillus benzoevorans]|uniref:Methyl-accepting chemotaxis protein n=1 Tax=Bacillus benzoevorans TaxID=1456 RepID=A0A7X0HRE4_9BACI|nr:HAMP domain-containing methyl-accepting chemotaxis protein [Bacillus benzoevorans]MBB6445537.1 methyl-accepting chemotaxis protein [Bacillus benzoevorans]